VAHFIRPPCMRSAAGLADYVVGDCVLHLVRVVMRSYWSAWARGINTVI